MDAIDRGDLTVTKKVVASGFYSISILVRAFMEFNREPPLACALPKANPPESASLIS